MSHYNEGPDLCSTINCDTRVSNTVYCDKHDVSKSGCPCCGSTALIIYFCDAHDRLWTDSIERKALLKTVMDEPRRTAWTKATTTFISRIKAQEIPEASKEAA